MSAEARPLSRTSTSRAARVAVVAALVAVCLGLAMGLAHAAGAVGGSSGHTVAPAHAPVLVHEASATGAVACATCGDPQDGLAVACLITLTALALMATVRPRPVAPLVTRRPLPTAKAALPRVDVASLTPGDLGICRT